MQKRSERNRKRSKRRSIYCPIHHCYLDSASPKYALFADSARQLQQRGISRKNALLLVSQQVTVALHGEWLEAFWCPLCQRTEWYHVRKLNDGTYQLSTVSQDLWRSVQGVIDPNGNPSVGQFTRQQARVLRFNSI